ncbi:hypothetical protein, partial [Streptomyces sp. bgisy154]
MLFEPTDVVVRIALNLVDAGSADAAMAACRPLVAELAPRAVEFEAADPAGLRRGFLGELLVVLPSVPAAAPGESLRRSVEPLMRRLGLRPEWLAVDDDPSRTGADAHAPDPVWERGGTEYGVYSLYARIGGDPFETDPDDGADDEDDPDDEWLPVGSPEEAVDAVQELLAHQEHQEALFLSLTCEVAGVDTAGAQAVAEELAGRVRPAVPGRCPVQVGEQEGGRPVVGALLGPTGLEAGAPEAALGAARAALALPEAGWDAPQVTGSGAARYVSVVWRATVPPERGPVRVALHAGTGRALARPG